MPLTLALETLRQEYHCIEPNLGKALWQWITPFTPVLLCMAETQAPQCEASMRLSASGIHLLRFCVCGCCACMYIWTPLVCMAPGEARREQGSHL